MISSFIIDKPITIFERDREWSELMRFVASPTARLGLVYGRRRLGKTHLVDHLAREAGGLYFCAAQQSSAANLADLSRAVTDWLGGSNPIHYSSWDEALQHLFRLEANGNQPSHVLVLDEVGYLIESDPAFPSLLQRALDRRPRPSAKLLLSGSNQAVMRNLTASGQPLRGRANVEIVLTPFNFRSTAAFWGIRDARTAILHWSVVGGTPAYRELCDNEAPSSERDFPRWMSRHLLTDSSALHREGRVVVMEEASLVGPTSHWAVLSAITGGASTRDAIAEAIARPATSLSNSLAVLTSSGLVARVDDPLHARRSTYVIDEPIVTAWKELVEPLERRIVRGDPSRMFDDIEAPLHSHVVAPAFERLVSNWAAAHASDDTMGGRATAIGHSHLGRGFGDAMSAQIDLVAVERQPSGRRRILTIGEVKHRNRPAGVAELRRLEMIRDRLLARHDTTAFPKLLLACDAGFDRDLLRLDRTRSDLELVDADRLLHGD